MIKVVSRIVTAAVGVPAIVLLSLRGGWPFFLLVLALAMAGLFEYYRLTHVPLLLQCCGYLLGTVLLITVDVQGLQHSWLVFTGGVVLLLCVVLFGFADYSFEQAGAALLGVCYVPMLLSYLLLLRALPQGQKLTVLTFVLTWTVDSAAFLIGSRLGHQRLAPRISPHKTWAGALAGLGGSVAVSIWAASYVGLSLTVATVMGAAVGIAAMVGDLVESALKRLAKVKDAGNILPGHGGILDRFDALLLVAPTVYFVLSGWR